MIEEAEQVIKSLEELLKPKARPKTHKDIVLERRSLRNIYRPWQGKKPRVVNIYAHEAQPGTAVHATYNEPSQEVLTNEDETLDMIMQMPKEPIIPSYSKYPEKMSLPDSRLSLHDVVKYFKEPMVNPATGHVIELVGSEDLAVISTLCYVNGICFGIEGDSGSGKSLIMDKWADLVKDSDLITIKQATNKALHSMAEDINSKKWVYFAEIQKIAAGNNGGKSIVELLKDLSEGREARFSYYVNRTKSETAVIKPINVCYTRAIENSWDLDRELSRRFVKLVTESGIEHTREVNQKQLENWVRLDYDDSQGLHPVIEHVQGLAGASNLHYIDPFAFAFGERIRDIPKSDSFLPLYGNLLRASAKFHINDRLSFKHKGKMYVLLQIQDHYAVSEAYHGHFLRSMEAWNGVAGEKSHVDWSDYFQKGAYELANNESLQKLRQKDTEIVEKWLEKQIQSTEIIAQDFRTGNNVGIGMYGP